MECMRYAVQRWVSLHDFLLFLGWCCIWDMSILYWCVYIPCHLYAVTVIECVHGWFNVFILKPCSPVNTGIPLSFACIKLCIKRVLYYCAILNVNKITWDLSFGMQMWIWWFPCFCIWVGLRDFSRTFSTLCYPWNVLPCVDCWPVWFFAEESKCFQFGLDIAVCTLYAF